MEKIIVLVAGARPNFMKISPINREFRRRGIVPLFCHTGQHEDYFMSGTFINEFRLPQPDFYGMGNAPNDTDLVIIVGDVNSSRESAEISNQRGFKIAHVEAGLRSFDNEMPEEYNRREIDRISDYLFVTEQQGIDNLKAEGITKNVFLVGNVMIDTLIEKFPPYVLLTLHRPSNVDKRLDDILEMMSSFDIPVIYPVHPRVIIDEKYLNIQIQYPMPYRIFIQAIKDSILVVTDSGGVQEECAYLGKKCVTLRENTERPITLKYGNHLVYDLDEAERLISDLITIPLWDGCASNRIVNILMKEII